MGDEASSNRSKAPGHCSGRCSGGQTEMGEDRELMVDGAQLQIVLDVVSLPRV